MSTTTDSPWVVLKFGGTSISNASNWKNVTAVVRSGASSGILVNVSAQSIGR